MALTITLNGSPHPLERPVPLNQLLSDIGLAGKPVVVELDQQPVFPRDYPLTIVEPGSSIEIITLAAGG